MDKIYFILFNILKFIVQKMPIFITNFMLNIISYILFLIGGKHKRVSLLNLDLALKDNIPSEYKKRIVFQGYKNILYNLADFIRNQGIQKEELLEKITFQNENILLDALKNKEKIIIQTAHYGNWELLGLAIASKFHPMVTVGRELDSPLMNDILKKNREQLNMEVISKKGAIKGMIKALNNNHLLGVLVDQNTNDNEGVIVNFFNQKVRHTPSLGIISRKLNALIIPAFIETNDNKQYTITFYKSFKCDISDNKEQDILKCVQRQASITEEIIKKKPEEWFWFHKRFKYKQEDIYD